MKNRKNYIVATVEENQAIDFTKVYKIKMVKGVRTGTELRFDTAENVIMTDFPTSNLTDKLK